MASREMVRRTVRDHDCQEPPGREGERLGRFRRESIWTLMSKTFGERPCWRFGVASQPSEYSMKSGKLVDGRDTPLKSNRGHVRFAADL
jgi:hypothetical protein